MTVDPGLSVPSSSASCASARCRGRHEKPSKQRDSRRNPSTIADWLFEPKWNGFRALAHTARCQNAILDGEIACLEPDGRSHFHKLLFRHALPYFTFEVLRLDGKDAEPAAPLPQAPDGEHHADRGVTRATCGARRDSRHRFLPGGMYAFSPELVCVTTAQLLLSRLPQRASCTRSRAELGDPS
jgi:hypothetical protein